MLQHRASLQCATQLTSQHAPIAWPACRLTALGTSRTAPGCPRPPHRLGQSEVSSPASSPFPKHANKPFLANLRYGKFDLRSLCSRNQVLFEISQTTLLVLTNQLADVFTGSAPIAGGYLPLYIFLESFGE